MDIDFLPTSLALNPQCAATELIVFLVARRTLQHPRINETASAGDDWTQTAFILA